MYNKLRGVVCFFMLQNSRNLEFTIWRVFYTKLSLLSLCCLSKVNRNSFIYTNIATILNYEKETTKNTLELCYRAVIFLLFCGVVFKA